MIGERDAIPTPESLINSYVVEARKILSALGYDEDRIETTRELVLAYYAEIIGDSAVPRVAVAENATKEEAFKALRDVVAHQVWGKVLNQHARVQEVFGRLNFGIVRDDQIGIKRGMAVRKLLASYYRGHPPVIYFDNAKRFPKFYPRTLNFMRKVSLNGSDIFEFDSEFAEFLVERTEAGNRLLEIQKPGGMPYEIMPFNDENPAWVKYCDDYSDYQVWYDKTNRNT